MTGGAYKGNPGEPLTLEWNPAFWQKARDAVYYAGKKGANVQAVLIDTWYCKTCGWGSQPCAWPREDIEAFSDMAGKPTMRAWVGEVDGEIVALDGFAFMGGRWIGFCDLREPARKYKKTIVRWAKLILEDARAHGVRFIYADADLNEPNSVRWLRSLGFTVDPRSD